MKEISLDEFKKLFDANAISENIRLFTPDYLVCFENQQLDSSELGHRTSLCIGAYNNYKSLSEIEGKWLYDLPSQRQYPIYFCRIHKNGVSENHD